VFMVDTELRAVFVRNGRTHRYGSTSIVTIQQLRMSVSSDDDSRRVET
jgi:hypothetical protein